MLSNYCDVELSKLMGWTNVQLFRLEALGVDIWVGHQPGSADALDAIPRWYSDWGIAQMLVPEWAGDTTKSAEDFCTEWLHRCGQ